MKGHLIENMTHFEVKELLGKDTIVVIPVGGGVTPHGRHLPMGTDMMISQYLADKVTEKTDVITIPILSYSNYHSFLGMDAAVSLEARTFIDVIKDICISFCRHGVRKFVVINEGEDSIPPLYTVATEINNEWNAKVAIALGGLGSKAAHEVLENKGGSHAGERDTSIILHLCPELVHMDKAEAGLRPVIENQFVGPRGFMTHYITRRFRNTPNAVDGDPTKATADKGRAILDCMVDDIVYFIDNFRKFEITTY